MARSWKRCPWLAPYARVTRRLAEQVARLCAVLPIKHVADFFGVGWETVKAIDAAHLEATLGPIDLTDVRVLAMDEFAIQEGHRYATDVEPLQQAGAVGRPRAQSRDGPGLLSSSASSQRVSGRQSL